MTKTPHVDDGLNPHLSNGNYSPLSALVRVLHQQFGDFSAGTSSASTHPLALHLANAVLDEVNLHPYQEAQIPYYDHIEQSRPIADSIIVAGLLAKYAEQQGSKRTGYLMSNFYRVMNGTFHRNTLGTGSITVRPMDGGSDPALPETTHVSED